ncbi:tetratricopeptide repeat domain [Nesidiocoris tenuis]|uniref:Tetratricopeptide repeat domain n=1 Tax=Nesidiocoris tenuis TaxID=355587 RepID=A0ABN7APT9_9HEMI|nr:tetratricopeptide repeat domain [Nesidiocoris tenuis]
MTDNNEVQALKEKGNESFKEGKYLEATLYYSRALALDPKNYTLFSNRSAAFLKSHQYYFAHDDAQQTIRLQPTWAKGYFRKGEVEAATFNFEDAVLSFRCALELQPGDATITEALSRTTFAMNREKKASEQVPWLGAGVGIVLGVSIVMVDQLLTASPSISHPILMAIITMVVALFGFALAKGYRYYLDCQRKSLMDPPPDLMKNTAAEDAGASQTANSEKTNHQRYSKAQARYKFRKGKT